MADLPAERIEKLERIRQLGIDPFGQRYDDAQPLDEAKGLFSETQEARVRCAGRVTAKRTHGKSAFLDIRDWTGKLQLYMKLNVIGAEEFAKLDLIDIGDFIGIEGPLFKTRTEEITVNVEKLTFLGKSLRPLPEKWHGLQNVELRYRQRYLDLISNPDVMDVFKTRARIVASIRSQLRELGFLEVETPMMQPQPGGAAARPFVTHHNALNIDLYLRIAPELYLKRLLVGGMEKVFEINRNFRNEGLSQRHNPEFTMMELYQAYADYGVMMDITEGLFSTLAEELGVSDQIEYNEKQVNLARPWKRLKYKDLFEQHAGVSIDDREGVIAKAKELGIERADAGHFDIVNEIFEELVEPTLVDPTFIIDYPTPLCPLTKTSRADPEYAERFELYIANMEVANAYTELNDPLEQRNRFTKQLALATQDMGSLDEDFLEALEHGMPPAGGLGIGIDRLVMILTQQRSIREVILFPLLKPQQRGDEEAADSREEPEE